MTRRQSRPPIRTPDGRIEAAVCHTVVMAGNGEGPRVETTAKAGLHGDSWSTSAAWGDIDGDGYADLYICHYVNWSFANNPKCSGYSGDVTQDEIDFGVLNRQLLHFPQTIV